MPVRRYRYLSWHRNMKVWVVQRKGQPSPGSHPSQDEAAKMAAAAFKMPLDKLRLPTAKAKDHKRHKRKSTHVRLYKHVYYHAARRVWTVVLKGQPSPGSCQCQHQAAKLAAKVLRVPLAKLQLRQSDRPSLQPQNVHQERFRQLWRVYQPAAVPGDLDSLFQPGSCHFIRRAPEGLLLPFLLAKYGPHRQALASAWATEAKKAEPKDAKDKVQAKGQEAVCRRNFKIMAMALTALHEVPLGEAWTANVGRGTTHHSGLVTLAHLSLGMLQPAANGALQLGNALRRYQLLPFTHRVQARLLSWHRFGAAMAAAKPPTTLAEWEQEMRTLQASSKGVCGLAGPRSYRTLWVCRSWLIFRMRSSTAKINRLTLDPGCSTATFCQLFPDQKAWVAKLSGKRCGPLLVEELFNNLGCPSLCKHTALTAP